MTLISSAVASGEKMSVVAKQTAVASAREIHFMNLLLFEQGSSVIRLARKKACPSGDKPTFLPDGTGTANYFVVAKFSRPPARMISCSRELVSFTTSNVVP